MLGAKQIEWLSVETLIPYAKNARTHSDEQVAQIAGSIKEFGFNNPVLVDKDNSIIAGHGRLMAARKLGMDIWDIKRTAKNDLHPTMKPIELIEKALIDASKPNNIVLDLFGGSGSTMIAAEKIGRKSRLMELDPKYCDVIVKRWEDFTGKKAVLSDLEKE